MSAAEQSNPRVKFRLSVKLTAAVLVILVTAVLFEAMARIVFVYREDIRKSSLASGVLQRSLILDPYEMPSPEDSYHWVLRPGYQATKEKLMADKMRAGRELGARALRTGMKEGTRTGDAGFRINRAGFKGPELDPSHARPRILALGDSTTFGMGPDNYPRHLETALKRRGIAAEVINGGVEGYCTINVLFELDRYRSLKPEIVTLFIGWNALYSRLPWPNAWENRLRIVWLVSRAYNILMAISGDSQAYAKRMYNRQLKPDPVSPKVGALQAYTPPFMGRIERIIDEFESIGTEVVLVTLPGLFTVSGNPSPQALKIGHLPAFTENPFVLAKLTERYNAALRALADRRRLGIIDLEKWSVSAFQPRESFFLDSVHLTARGLEMIGSFMAEQLAGRVKKR